MGNFGRSTSYTQPRLSAAARARARAVWLQSLARNRSHSSSGLRGKRR